MTFQEKIIFHKNIKNSRLATGKALEYQKIVSQLPDVGPCLFNLDQDCPQILTEKDLDPQLKKELYLALKNLGPWRKGPFDFFKIKIDSEWKSNLKWDRIKSHLPELKNKKILDIGSGNAYYLCRMLPYEPNFLLGVDRSLSAYYQFLTIQNYLQSKRMDLLPIDFMNLKGMANEFDLIFAMGILYHQKAPLIALEKIRDLLCPKGFLFLEGLYIEGDEQICLCPERYAKMNNVHFIPTIKTLKYWLDRTGFQNIEVLDLNRTEENEQRKTDWIRGESLKDFLDPANPNLTLEGWPAPRRFCIKAQGKLK